MTNCDMYVKLSYFYVDLTAWVFVKICMELEELHWILMRRMKKRGLPPTLIVKKIYSPEMIGKTV